MKSGVWVLDHDTGYRNIKKDLVGWYGQETVRQIWEKSGANWEELCARYAHLPEKMKQHTSDVFIGMLFHRTPYSCNLVPYKPFVGI